MSSLAYMVTSVSRTTRASTSTSTFAAPACFRARVQAETVAPVVNTSSTSRTRRPEIRVAARLVMVNAPATSRGAGTGRQAALRGCTPRTLYRIDHDRRAGQAGNVLRQPAGLAGSAPHEPGAMQGHGHDQVRFIDQPATRLQHPAGQCAKPVAAGGRYRAAHTAPVRMWIWPNSSGASGLFCDATLARYRRTGRP